jgi:hypothetical protein
MKPCNPILREIDYRTELPRFLNDHGLTGAGAEIGVYTGTFSKTILETWKGRQLIGVDPYIKFTNEEYFDSTQDANQELIYAQAQAVYVPYGPRANLVRLKSLDAAPGIQDGSLDFVFIDGNHSYEASSADIAAWYPKVKSGGLFSGHDFYTRLKDTNSDALNAVLDFAESINTRPHATWCNSWYFIKP